MDRAATNLVSIMTTKPHITISSQDLERLEILLDSLPPGSFPGKQDLEEELERATIVEPANISPTVVTMNSTVRFRIEPSGESFCLTLVYPRDVDAEGRTISILAPVGSALLGLSLGDEIQWPRPGGGVLRVRIEDIIYQPERAGDYQL